MFDYLQKYKNLPADIKNKFSSPGKMSAVKELEEKYGLDLASMIMKIAVKDIPASSLDKYFSAEAGLSGEAALGLAADLEEKIFFDLKDYLGIKPRPTPPLSASPAVSPASLATPTPSFAVPPVSSNFFFHAEDEEEVKKISGQIGLDADREGEKNQFESAAQEAIRQSGVSLGSGEMIKRLEKMIITYLRGVRSRIDTRQALLKPFASGGLDLDEKAADKILSFAKIIPLSPLAPKPKRIILPEDKVAAAPPERDIPYDFSALKKAEPIVPIMDPARELPAGQTAGEKEEKIEAPDASKKFAAKKVIEEIIRQQTAQASDASNQPKITEIKKPSSSSLSARSSAPLRSPLPPSMSAAASGKARMQDVKIPTIMTPLDEILYLDLVNFRRLSGRPEEAAKKIKEKIDLIGEEGYGERIKAVGAWRSSPVYNLYLEIGRESIGQGRAINVIINERLSSGRPTLNREEWSAVMGLNRIVNTQ